MKKVILLLALFIIWGIVPLVYAEDAVKGGRILESADFKAEFYLEEERSATISFYDNAMKPIPVSTQKASVIADGEKGKVIIDFQKQGDDLKSTLPLPDEEGLGLVVRIWPSEGSDPQNFRFKLETHICEGCGRGEYACDCHE